MLSQLGYWMTTTGLQWSVSEATDSDPLALGLLYFVALVPLLVLSPWAGTLADRHERARLIAWAQGSIALMCLAFLTFVELVPSLGLGGTFTFAFGIGTMLALSAPAGQSLIASLVPQEDLTSAIGMQSMSMNAARIAGPSLTGALLVGSATTVPVLVYAVTAAVSAWTAWRLPALPRPRGSDAAESAWRRMRSGVSYVRRNPPCGMALLMLAGTSVMGASYVSLLPAVATETLGGGPGTFTALVVATGIGAMLGVLVTSWRDRGTTKPGTIAAHMAALAVGVASLGVVSFLPASLVLAALTAGVNFAIMARINALLNSRADNDHRGRVMSLYVLAWAGLVPVGALLLAGLAALTSLAIALATSGALLALFTLCVVWWHRRSAKRSTTARQ